MFAIKILSCINRSFSRKCTTISSSLQHIRRSSFKAKHPTSYDVKPQAVKDVVLFTVDRRNFFVAVNIVSAIQCGVWTYLGIFLVQSTNSSDVKSKSLWAGSVVDRHKYSYIVTGITIFLGWALLASTIFYSFRSIRKIILHKGGNFVTLVTHGLPGWNVIKVPVSQVSCLEHRAKAKKYIPLRLKNSFFFYLIDIHGEFLNTQLFDFTVGIKRGF